MIKKHIFFLAFLLITGSAYCQNYEWQLLPNSPVPQSSSGRFEDIYFTNLNTGYIALYAGSIYKTTNGGNSWTQMITAPEFPNANYRSLGFFNSSVGILGTLRFSSPLFRTTNGGINWVQVGTPEPRPYGICGISIVNEQTAYAVGRYSAPANVIKTTNQGANWTSIPMDTSLVRSLVDCHFWTPDSGIVVGGYSGTSYSVGNAVVLLTTNGGNTWTRVFRSNRSGEWCWKISFISREVGFVSIERHSGMSYYLKTTDGGLTWQEFPFMVYDQEGIGFINENTGWIGGWTGPTYKTTNGGANWFQLPTGYFINRYRFLNNFTAGYAVGDRVYKLVPDNGPFPIYKFAVVGNYGKAGNPLSAVSSYVHSWNPDFVMTSGNNNYETGSASTIDLNIGQYFSRYIYPYTGSFGSGDTVNRFYPSLGEVDWMTPNATPYFDYFTLPGNERYYEFSKGRVRYFVLNSDPNEPDGTDSNSVQALWLKNGLANSTAEWNVVCFHHPPYSSGSTYGGTEYMRWPFKRWGANAVISGREGNYERLSVDGIPYFVNGLGGKSIMPFGQAVTGSVVRYNGDYGFIVGYEFQDYLEFRFYTRTGLIIDSHKLFLVPKTLNIKARIEGYVGSQPNPTFGSLVNVTLVNAQPPYQAVDSSKFLYSNSGTANIVFFNAANSSAYYIVCTQRNSIETWSSMPVSFTSNNAAYDFTDLQTRAYGNNLTLRNGSYCFFSGDVSQDGVIDGADFLILDNSAFAFVSGNVPEDLNGDLIVDAQDIAFVDNNAFNYIVLRRP